jgi:hypothetical protein
MITETKRPQTSWECYTPDMLFLNCAECARQFATEYGIELERGLHTYGETVNGCGVSECYACGHATDYRLVATVAACIWRVISRRKACST